MTMRSLKVNKLGKALTPNKVSQNRVSMRVANPLLTFVCDNAYSTRGIPSFIGPRIYEATKEIKANVGYEQDVQSPSPFSKVFVTNALGCKQPMIVTLSTAFLESYTLSSGGSL